MVDFIVEETGHEAFKRSFKYTAIYHNRNGKVINHVIRGNVPSKNQLHELVIADKALRMLRRNGFDRGRYQVPLPLGYDKELRLFLYEHSPGIPMIASVQRVPPKRRKAIIADAALAINKLHILNLTGPRFWTQAIIRSDIKYFKDDFRSLSGDFRDQAYHICDVLKERILSIWPKRKKYFRFIHGDYSAYNIIVRKRGLTVIDLGNSLHGDPLFDVASFLTQFEIVSAKGKMTSRLIDSMLKEFEKKYRSASNLNSNNDYKKILPIYRAWWLIQASAYITTIAKSRLAHKLFVKAQQYLSMTK